VITDRLKEAGEEIPAGVLLFDDQDVEDATCKQLGIEDAATLEWHISEKSELLYALGFPDEHLSLLEEFLSKPECVNKWLEVGPNPNKDGTQRMPLTLKPTSRTGMRNSKAMPNTFSRGIVPCCNGLVGGRRFVLMPPSRDTSRQSLASASSVYSNTLTKRPNPHASSSTRLRLTSTMSPRATVGMSLRSVAEKTIVRQHSNYKLLMLLDFT